MTKRIIAIIAVLVLAIGCVVALAETTTADPAATETPVEQTSAEPEIAAEATAETEATEETAAAEAEATAEPTPVPEGKTRYISARSGLFIRETPDLKGKIVATPDFNYAVKVIGKEGKWSHVIYETNGRVFEGYAWSAYLSPKKIVLKPAAAPEPTPEPQPKPL